MFEGSVWRPRELVGSLLLVLALATTCGFSDEDFLCEEAVGRLVECCPGLDPRVIYCGRQGGCGATEPPYTFRLEESLCMVRSSCDSIRAAGLCTTTFNGLFPDGGTSRLRQKGCS